MSAVVQDAMAVGQAVPSPVKVVDVAALVTPIAGDNPSGENLQYTSVYDEIREARRADDNLAQGDWQREPKVPEWVKVIDISSNALATRTKDLQLAAWLTEALVELHGFVGLRDGLKVMRGLHENFWGSVYPLIEDGDLEARANALSFMDSKVEVPLKKLPLTHTGGGVDYSYIQWEESTKFDIPENLDTLEATAYERMAALKQQAEEEGKTTGETWRKAKDTTRRVFYEATNSVLNECWEEFQALDRVMDEKFGNHTPGLGALKNSLESIRSLVDKLVKEKRILEPDPVPASLAADGNSFPDGIVRVAGGPINTRADALRQLAEVAEYFKRAEPHSPVSYLVQRAIKWGQMPLELWLEDVIKDGNVLGQLKEVLGFGTSSTNDQSSQ
jgi:type VI secretion system protein ImpA